MKDASQDQDTAAMEAQALMDQAIQAFDAGDTASCLEHASRAVLLDPGNATLWFRKGLMSLPLDRYDEVIECYERALTINPRYVAAWFNKGLTHAILQQRMQALQCFERAIKLAPREVKAMYQKGKVLVELNKLQEAIKCFDCVISIDSKHAGAWHSRGAAFAALGDEEEALRCYIHCTRLNLGDADARYNKGVSEQALGLISDALVSYDEAIRHNPEHGLAWGNKGSLLLEGGRVREALLCFERAVRLGNARAANGIATCRKVLRKTRDGEPAKLHGQFAPGDIIENAFSVYEVHHGAMGVVYLSYDNRLKCPAAIKTIQERHASNPGLRRRFLEEGRIWARLGKHPNIVHCYGAMEGFDGRPYILLEHIEGDRAVGLSLRDWLKKGRLNLFNLLVFGIDICRGMSHAASSVPGFVHSDLKPENVLVTHDHTAKVTDFGLAKAFVEETNNRLGGTFAYASPEQIKGSTVDQRSDVYAFGCILHEMLTGRHPYRGMSMKAITRSHLEETPVPILPLGPEIPRRLQTLMRSCLEKKRERRPTGFLAICRELEQILEERTGRRRREVDSAHAERYEVLNRAIALHRLGQAEEGLELVEEVLAEGEFNPAWLVKGNILFDLKRYQDALSSFEIFLARHPDDDEAVVAAWTNRGNCLDHLERPQDALSCYEKALELLPGNANALFNKAMALKGIGELESAETTIDALLNRHPTDCLFLCAKGTLLEERGRIREAVDVYDQALKVDPLFTEALDRKGAVLQGAGRLEEALECFEKLAELNPGKPRLLYNQALVLFELGRNDEARTSIHRCLRCDPDYPDACSLRGRIERASKTGTAG